jgi:hypothetical protein
MSSLTDRRARRSPRGERDGDCGRPRRFNLYEKCYKFSIFISPTARSVERIIAVLTKVEPIGKVEHSWK